MTGSGSRSPGRPETLGELRLRADESSRRSERLERHMGQLWKRLYETEAENRHLAEELHWARQIVAGLDPVERARPYVLYTAIAAGYDRLKPPLEISREFDLVCFVDRYVGDSGPWQLRRFDLHSVDPARMTRFVKLHPHVFFSEYEASIWVDANLLLRGNPESVLAAAGDAVMAAFVHPHRQCIYDEAEEIIARGGLDDPATIREQMERYRAEGYPAGAGLFETNVLVRRHHEPGTVELMRRWWREIETGSKRDQLSLNYAIWKTGKTGVVAPLAKPGTSVRNDPRFERFLHGDRSTWEPDPETPEQEARAAETVEPQDAFGRLIQPANRLDLKARSLGRLELDVVVCVHNALDHVRRCLLSVLPTLEEHHRLVLVDDGSDDATRSYLEGLAARDDRIYLLRSDRAEGYTRAVNRGVRASRGDFVILLNSDTIVPHRWWRKLAAAAYASRSTGIVGPLSNAASWQSVPDMLDAEGRLKVNPQPFGTTFEDLDRLVEAHADSHFPRVQLLNGFCLAIKRRVFDEIGLFDEEAFPLGYGEENDFCFRACDAGFGLVVAANCYIHHAKSRSYSPARRDSLSDEGSKALRQRYAAARIGRAIESTKGHPTLVGIRDAVRLELAEREAAARQRRDAVKQLRIDYSRNDPDLAAIFDVTPEQVAESRRLGEQYRANPCSRPEVALWFVPQFDHVLRGGVRTIFAMAEDFTRTWGTRNIMAVYGPLERFEAPVEQIREVFPHLDWELHLVAEGASPASLPPSDVAFCTLWTSAYLLVKYPHCRGKFYLVQDFEPSFYEAGTTYALIEQSYRFGFSALANTVGVAREIARRCETVGYFVPGVDRQLFRPARAEEKQHGGVDRVVFYGRPPNPRNAFELGLEGLRLVKEARGDAVQLISVGARFEPREHQVDGIVENWGVLPTMEEVAALYRSAKVGLCFMYTPHPSYQPLEFMASGCATVTNHNPGNLWLFRDGYNMKLCDSLPSSVAAAILELLEDDELRATLARGGLETVSRLDWPAAFASIRAFVTDPLAHALPRRDAAEDPVGTDS